jgi:hypothetical protein
MPNTAEQIQTWLESLIGKGLDASGVVHSLPPAEREARRKRLAELGGAPVTKLSGQSTP